MFRAACAIRIATTGGFTKKGKIRSGGGSGSQAVESSRTHGSIMLRVLCFLPDPDDPPMPTRECACCGSRYPVKRRKMRLFEDDTLEGDVCPECVLAGPAGAAAKVRGRIRSRGETGGDAVDGVDRASWVRRMER